MPPKEFEFADIISYCFDDNGKYEKIGKLYGITELEPDIDSETSLTERFVNQEFSFTAKVDNSRRNWNNIRRYCMYGTNNWRKMHGLPMLSYKRYRHEKKS